MIYINSKDEELQLEQMNDFELKGAYKKMTEMIKTIARDCYGPMDSESYSDLYRYIEILIKNFYQEMEKRGLNKPAWEVDIEKDFVLASDQKKIKNIIERHFISAE